MQTQIKKIISREAGERYEEILGKLDDPDFPHEFIAEFARRMGKGQSGKWRNMRGKLFEYAICETLAMNNIKPFYFQGSFDLVPDVDFDVVLYRDKRPVALSLKTSVRERYKQAVLECYMLQRVYRHALGYIVTLEEPPEKLANLNRKIDEKEIIGVTKFIDAQAPEYSCLLEDLQSCDFCRSEKVELLKGKIY